MMPLEPTLFHTLVTGRRRVFLNVIFRRWAVCNVVRDDFRVAVASSETTTRGRFWARFGGVNRALRRAPVISTASVSKDGQVIEMEPSKADPASNKPLTNLAAAAAKSAPDALILASAEGEIRWASDATAAVLGWSPTELLGSSIDTFVPDMVRHEHASLREQFMVEGESRPMGIGKTLIAQHRDGSELHVEIGLSHVLIDGEAMVLAAVRDRSEHVRIEQDLQLARTDLARADERARVARDLHDTVSQDLYGLGLAVQRAQRRGLETADLDAFVDQIDVAIKQLASAIFELREIGGRVWFADQIDHVVALSSRALGFAPSVTKTGDLTTVSRTVGAQIVFVLRELLSNCAKHSKATNVDVSIRVEQGAIELMVSDDGVGMTLAIEDVVERSPGYGIAGVVRRAHMCGGTFECISPLRGRGTMMRWSSPTAAFTSR